MKVNKIKTHELEKCYAISPLTYNGAEHILIAAEKVNKCLLFDLDGNLEETVWDEPGGTMSMVQVPGSNGQFLATHKKLRNYMLNYLDIITTVSSIMLIYSGVEENLEKKNELWKYIKQKDPVVFFRLRYGLLGSYTNLPGKGGRKISVEGYKLCQRFFKFN